MTGLWTFKAAQDFLRREPPGVYLRRERLEDLTGVGI